MYSLHQFNNNISPLHHIHKVAEEDNLEEDHQPDRPEDNLEEDPQEEDPQEEDPQEEDPQEEEAVALQEDSLQQRHPLQYPFQRHNQTMELWEEMHPQSLMEIDKTQMSFSTSSASTGWPMRQISEW
jgi:hypothetical protein